MKIPIDVLREIVEIVDFEQHYTEQEKIQISNNFQLLCLQNLTYFYQLGDVEFWWFDDSQKFLFCSLPLLQVPLVLKVA